MTKKLEQLCRWRLVGGPVSTPYVLQTLACLMTSVGFLFLLEQLQVSSFGAEPRRNVLFIAIDDLRNDLGVLGASHAKTPNLDAFARKARIFSHHYAQVPTCGASRAALLRGRYPQTAAHLGNHAVRDTHSEWKLESLPATFRQNGYKTLALGKIGHFPGGMSGRNWTEAPEELPDVWDRSWVPSSPWGTPQAMMHGYANGVARRAGNSPPMEAHDGPDEAYPDAWIATEAIATLKELAGEEQPWFFAVGFFKPHLPFAAPRKYHDLHAEGVSVLNSEAAKKPAWPSGWHGSGEFRGNYGHPGKKDPSEDGEYAASLRRAYAASISYMDAQVGRVLAAFSESGLASRTIVVIWSDHGFLLGEHAIWGKHCLYEDALRSPLMISYPGMKAPGEMSRATVETVDIFPTLTELCGLPKPRELDGRSLLPQLLDPAAPSSKPAHGFWIHGQRTIRNDRWRLIVDGKGERMELFDYELDPYETQNHALNQSRVASEMLSEVLKVVSR